MRSSSQGSTGSSSNTRPYFERSGLDAFYPGVSVIFNFEGGNLHVPLAAQRVRLHDLQRHMTIVLGDNQYGKAETHIVRITRSGAQPRDQGPSTSASRLPGDFAEYASHRRTTARSCRRTRRKNTVFPRSPRTRSAGGSRTSPSGSRGTSSASSASVYRGARLSIEEFAWERIHDHAFVQARSEKRLSTVTCTDDGHVGRRPGSATCRPQIDGIGVSRPS